MELSESFDEDEFDDDSAYKSDNGRLLRRWPRGCLQFVKKIIDKFIVRGSYGLI